MDNKSIIRRTHHFSYRLSSMVTNIVVVRKTKYVQCYLHTTGGNLITGRKCTFNIAKPPCLLLKLTHITLSGNIQFNTIEKAY